MPDVGSPRGLETPGFRNDPGLLMQAGLARLRRAHEQIAADANVYAMGRQHEADAQMQAYQQMLAAPQQSPIPQEGLAPYLANAFAAGFTGNQNLANQGERAVLMNREELQRKRQELLQAQHEKLLLAARQADEAGDMARSLQYTQKANMALKEFETISGMAETRQRESDRRSFETQQTQQSQAFQAAQQAQELGFRKWLAMRDDPAIKAKIEGLQAGFTARTKALEATLSMPGSGANAVKAREQAMAELKKATDDYMAQIQALEPGAAQKPATPGAPAPAATTQPSGPTSGPAAAGPGSGRPAAAPAPTPAPKPGARVSAKPSDLVDRLQSAGLATDPKSLREWLAQKPAAGKFATNRQAMLDAGITETQLFAEVDRRMRDAEAQAGEASAARKAEDRRKRDFAPYQGGRATPFRPAARDTTPTSIQPPPLILR